MSATTDGSRSTAALNDLDWAANDVAVASDDGRISALTFGDADGEEHDAIRVSYEGLTDPPADIEFEIRLRGTDEGDGG